MIGAASITREGVAIMAMPLALALAGCDVGAAETGKPTLTSSPDGASFPCTPVKLWDGDGPVHCAEGPKVRLAGIAAREVQWTGSTMVDAGCRDGHPCPATSAVEAREHLAGLLQSGQNEPIETLSTGHIAIEGPTLSCTSNGSAGGSRTAAWCSSPVHGDLSCAMVRDGYALRWERYWRGHRC